MSRLVFRMLSAGSLRHCSPAQLRTADRRPSSRHVSSDLNLGGGGDEPVEDDSKTRIWRVHIVKRLNARRVKLHRNYSVDEAARLFQVHKNTARMWIKNGLQTIDGRRPTLILGRELARFLHERRQRTRQRCQPGQLYCVRCRAPKAPAAGIAEYLPVTPRSGNLKAQCGTCGAVVWRRVSLRSLTAATGNLQVLLPQALQRIADETSPSLNSNFDEVV